MSIHMAEVDGGDPTRIPSQIVTGIGFLGGGAILRGGQGDIRGLTTAATVWVNAAIGMAAAPASTALAITSTLVTLFVLTVFLRIENYMTRHAQGEGGADADHQDRERPQSGRSRQAEPRFLRCQSDSMPFLGAHLSIAGGIPKAVERAEAAGCEALQIFTKSVGQWKARVLDDSEVAQFRDAVSRSRLRAVVAHASYLSNLASPNPVLREQSLASLGEELDRSERLGLLGLVMHPGTADEAEGLPRIAAGHHAAAARRAAEARR